ncbi:arsenite efflux transporter metallochaperone ArsD [Jeotgalibacillus haloalkalitolerans]|uniref:Arsenite efflux transporter metallochaperone ArsD n=1 Tax=Jeotgalibacillus haloalkalitolerans TaxID=3104292 RepID=A0ABU5KQW3_9BACL|nr:arsenite efflux transporter metallochaperone ArsD [Jeotgalibacillus sp. HH7-29]MDZ5713560.1 arsenite efflux transporter metallochaperone ArsD [Jeotgalibacillus sp. HH7-29]
MKKIKIFDPAMCCSTGVCGTSFDPELPRVASVVSFLKQKNYPIERFNLTSEPQRFVENKTVQEALAKNPEGLPFTLVDGVIVQQGTYLSNQAFAEVTGISEDQFPASGEAPKPKIRLTIE